LRVLKRIFGTRGDEEAGSWELYKWNLYCSPSIIRWAGQVARIGERMTASRILVGKSEGGRPVERPIILRYILERERIGWCGLDRSGSG
jgi:hypothetical protein